MELDDGLYMMMPKQHEKMKGTINVLCNISSHLKNIKGVLHSKIMRSAQSHPVTHSGQSDATEKPTIKRPRYYPSPTSAPLDLVWGLASCFQPTSIS